MLCMLLYLYGEWKLTGFFSIVVHQMLKKKKYLFLLQCHYCHIAFILTIALMLKYHVLLIQFFLELKISFALLHLENGEMQSIIGKDRLRHQLSFYGVPFGLGNLDRTVFGAVTFPSCSSVVSLITRQISLSQSSSVRTNPDNVLVLVAVTTPSAARLLLYSFVQRNVNVQDNTTQYLERVWPSLFFAELSSLSVHVSTVISHVSQQFRFLVFLIVAEWITSSTSSSFIHALACVFTKICNHVDKYVITKHYLLMPLSLATYVHQMLKKKKYLFLCGLRHPMKLVPFATRVHMDVKAFPSRPSVPLLITNSQRRNSIFNEIRQIEQQWIPSSENLFSRSQRHSQIAFPTVLMFFLDTQESWHTKNMKKPRTSVTKCMTLRLLYTSSLTGLLTVFLNGN
ncbi:hypothetical protein T05_10213 [Trichinella murrelli]|uniref:Uncharacterized protein n=5 Tax=Trichinella TaxID=6333 RepID=A0A0V0TZU1_9BILA|nr:hypothetical protein T05_10213 [Trichinella murrelli]